jgi:hypothetical protein
VPPGRYSEKVGCYGQRVIFEAVEPKSDWFTMVVRAPSEQEAEELARETFAEYLQEVGSVELKHLDPDGPPGVLIEDPS